MQIYEWYAAPEAHPPLAENTANELSDRPTTVILTPKAFGGRIPLLICGILLHLLADQDDKSSYQTA